MYVERHSNTGAVMDGCGRADEEETRGKEKKKKKNRQKVVVANLVCYEWLFPGFAESKSPVDSSVTIVVCIFLARTDGCAASRRRQAFNELLVSSVWSGSRTGFTAAEAREIE